MTLFKEYKKSSLSDPRQTFEASVSEKMNELNSSNSVDFNEYLLDVAPFIESYYSDSMPQEEENHRNVTKVSKESICNYVTTSRNNNKKSQIYKEYMKKFHTQNFNRVDNLDMCTNCNSSLPMVSEMKTSSLICKTCGFTDFCPDIGNSMRGVSTFNIEDLPDITPHYSYKRSNHFSEWLSQLQARESTTIPDTLIEQIYIELKKERITDNKYITHTRIRGYLKKLKLNKYYEHIPHIIRAIKGEKVPTISMEVEEKLRYMFNMIQVPFEKHCPKNRKNFLSYSYTLFKMAQVIGEDHMLTTFYLPLLKSRDKLAVQDTIWKGICKELNWEFIPTV